MMREGEENKTYFSARVETFPNNQIDRDPREEQRSHQLPLEVA